MHGIVHKMLKDYVDEETGDWNAVRERAGIEPKLYLPVSTYPDEEVDVVLETMATTTGRERETIEREFGRALAPALLDTFKVHVLGSDDLQTLLERLDQIYANLDGASDDTEPPELSSSRDGDGVVVSYRSDRDYCAVARGILEGTVDEYDATASVAEHECVHDGDDACSFRVELEE